MLDCKGKQPYNPTEGYWPQRCGVYHPILDGSSTLVGKGCGYIENAA